MSSAFGTKVGLRYLFAKSSGFSKLVNSVSIGGLALGIMLLIVVSSVHNGLADERRVRLLKVVPHAFLADSAQAPTDVGQIRAVAGVVAMNREFHGMALVQGHASSPVTIELIGLDLANSGSSNLDFVEGSLTAENADSAIALPYFLASRLGVLLGDQVNLTFVAPTKSGLETRAASFKVEGLFQFSTELDANAAFVGLQALADNGLLATGKLGWNISVEDPFAVDTLFADDPRVVTWVDEHGEAFRAYQLERAAMYVLMTLVLMLASFNIIAGQAMLVNVKRSDIAILATMGASRRQLTRAFAIQGGAITLLGIVIGLMLGLAISFNINVIFDAIDDWLGISILEQTAFKELPARVALLDVLGAVVLAAIFGALALIKPLRIALRESPVFVLNRTG